MRQRKTVLALLLSVILLLPMCVSAGSPGGTEQSPAEAEKTEQTGIADCRVLDYVDEKSFSEARHISRLPEKEELNTYVFLNSDGTETMYMLG